jgi:hypothetical protein
MRRGFRMSIFVDLDFMGFGEMLVKNGFEVGMRYRHVILPVRIVYTLSRLGSSEG